MNLHRDCSDCRDDGSTSNIWCIEDTCVMLTPILLRDIALETAGRCPILCLCEILRQVNTWRVHDLVSIRHLPAW
jgi:hypothetical protein